MPRVPPLVRIPGPLLRAIEVPMETPLQHGLLG